METAYAMGNRDVAAAMGNGDVALPTSYNTTGPIPKPPTKSGYALFSSDYCTKEAYKVEFEARGAFKRSAGVTSQIVGPAWKKLAAAEKAVWNDAAKAAQTAYWLKYGSLFEGKAPKETKRKSASDSSESGDQERRAPKTAAIALADGTHDVSLVTDGPWVAIKLNGGPVYVIRKQFPSEDAMRSARAAALASRKKAAPKKGAAPDDEEAAEPEPESSLPKEAEEEAEEEEPAEPAAEPEPEPEPASERKSKRARKTSR